MYHVCVWLRNHVCVWLQERVLTPRAWWGLILCYYLQYWVWKVQICSNAIWSNSGSRCLSAQAWCKIRQVMVIADDLMTVGKKLNHCDHDQALTTLLDTARRCNVWLNYEKLQYKKQEVNFLWNLLKKWMQASSEQSYSNHQDAYPTNRKQVQSFIGMINYLSKFFC